MPFFSYAQKKADFNSVKLKISERDKLNAEITKAVESIFEKEKGFLMKETLDSLNNEIAKKHTENLTLQNKNAELQKSIKHLVIKLNEDSLKQVGLKKKAEEVALQKGEQNIIDRLAVFYTGSMDEIIANSNKDVLERDLVLLSGKNEISAKMKSVIDYYNIKNSLSKKLFPSELQQAKLRLNGMLVKENSENVKMLIELIELYQSYKETLITFLKRISTYDTELTAGVSRNFQDEKKTAIKNLGAEYFNHEYIVTLFEFKFLHSIYNELMTRKMENPDAEFADLLKKLEE